MPRWVPQLVRGVSGVNRRGGPLSLALRVGGAALVMGAVTQLVIHATEFSHDQRYLTLLLKYAVEGWLLVLGWTALWGVRLVIECPSTLAMFAHSPAYGVSMASFLFVLATPFTNAYFSHITHPALALALVWSVWPWVERLYERLSVLLAARVPQPTGMGVAPFIASAGATVLFFVQSYRRHIWFGSGGKDLGLFHQSVWLLSRGESPENTVMGMHAFADHLEFIDFAAAPLQWVWPDAGALLLFQAVLVGAGVIPVFDLARRRLGSRLAGWALAAVYALGVDLQHAVMFDWNPTTCGAGLLPWVVWFFSMNRPVAFGISLAAVALTKENLVLYALGLCLALAVGRERRRQALVAAALLAVFFVVEMKLIFPLFQPEGFRHLRYEQLGHSAGGIARTVLASPYHAFALLFTPGAKINGLLAPLSTVAFACVLAPRYLLALAPAILERFWSSHENRWWGFHYGAGMGVLATLAAVDGLARLRSWLKRRGWTSLASMSIAVVLVSCLLVGTLAHFGTAPVWLARHPYYTTPQDRADVEAVLQVIPAEAAVAAQNHLIPHLSARREIYPIARPVRAEYVALDMVQNPWPWESGYPLRLGRELAAGGYGAVACQGAAVVLRRGAPSRPCPILSLPVGGR